MPDLVTIEGVEIGSVGMEWKASNGTFTLTTQNLVDVMTAANDDPHIVTPRLKLGHEGWPEMDGLDSSPFGTSAEPALGRAVNFRLTNDGATLVADYVDVPAWIPAAYPSRSGEWVGNVDPVFTDGVTTPGGKRYSIVLTAVALLGVAAPALSDIEDLEAFLTTGTTDSAAVVVTTSLEETMPAPVTATRADIDTVQRSFWSEFAQGDYLWWWPRDIFTDPNEVLADDDEGHLYRVGFTSDTNGDIAWGDPQRVRIDLVDIPDATAATVATAYRAVASTTAELHRTFATAAAARPKDRHTQKAAADVAATQQAGSSGRDHEENPMDDDVREFLVAQGLDPEKASEDQINAASVFIAAGITPSDDGGTPETPETPGTKVDEPEPVAASKADDDPVAARLELLERQNRELLEDKTAREAAATAAKVEDRLAHVARATAAGVIKPSEVETWTTRVKDPTKGEAFAEVLATMAPQLSTREAGGTPDELNTVATSSEPLPDNVSLLTPAERAKRAA